MFAKQISGLRAAVIVTLVACSQNVFAATYYVDDSAGNDSNDGLSQSSALRSVTAAGALSLRPGDSVFFRRGQDFAGTLSISDNGNQSEPIRISAFGGGNERPVLFGLSISGDWVTVDGIDIDHEKDGSDAIRVRGGRSLVFRNMEVRNGTRDAFDVDNADGLLVEDVEIHHFLNGSFGSEDDSHGLAITNTDGVTIRRTNIHHVSGDSIQADPNRKPGGIATNILVEDSVFWTGPLSSPFNSGWPAGASPGENALDTKVLKTGFENEIRMKITLRNITAYGWTAVPEISNRAVFNLKEKIDAELDRVTVYDSEIAFRVRGSLGNADTRISNAVVYDVGTAIRAEDNVTGLEVLNSTFGDGIDRMLRHAGGSGGTGSWTMLNNAFLSSKPSEAGDSSNVVAQSSDFVNPSSRNYALAAGSSLINQGVAVNGVTLDREGAARVAPFDIGAYEFGNAIVRPNPPVLTAQ
ncbi:MAG: right-handed parallel beta-helix repeat-containing protein [Pseudomonadota bacterium]